ncbi:sensor histidine kinase [Paenibacillus marchantiophytorum]|uniref:histidine kinase n=1 Tax=Paenibacillus marchantiophytorum TaxID=1619310 RepID=A0ABQ1ELU1_9BACL|nr:sensor histidine kinase [Paenibacillus marchantiophytorum]GFZ77702.1 sensor histidine kinase [Paenibacillus marchantiophytorum]
MKALISWFGSWGMLAKHFLFLSLGTLVLLGGLGWINLREAEGLFRRQVVSDAQIIIDRTNLYMNAYLDNVQNILMLISTREDLLNEGKEKEAADVLRSYANMNRTLYKSLYLVGEDGHVISNSQTTFDIIGNPQIPILLTKAKQTYGMFITEPYQSPMSGKTVAFVLPIQSSSTKLFKGIAVVEIDLVQLTNLIAQFMNTKNQTFAIITNKKNVVHSFDAGLPLSSYRLLPYNTSVFPPELDAGFVDKVSELPLGAAEITGSEGDLVAVKSGMNKLGWYFIAFYENSFFYQNIRSLYRNFSTAGVFWIFLVLISTYMISRYITLPVRTLVAKMDRVRDMEVLHTLHATGNDEIGRLARSYNAMMERIHHLLQETKEAERRKKHFELKMLQSQIAPHFLYNTLACISSLAKQHKIDEVRETIKTLVGLLSFSFDKSTEFVTLADELEGLRMYAYIQKVRYGDKFTMEIDAASETLSKTILKLTLQPLVENAIFHGIVPLKREGTIRIRTKCVKDKLIITIRDNGLGMNSEVLNSLFEERHKAPSKHRFTGIGIMNVQERIGLHFGTEYGLSIFSRPESGTLIRIELPAVEHEQVEKTK